MASENETVKDIAKEIGDAYETWKRFEIAELPTQYLMEWRDRLDVAYRSSEEAHQSEVSELKSKMNDVVCENEALRDACGTCGAKREREAAREKSSLVGNSAKMRDALNETQSVIAKCMDILNRIPSGVPYDGLIDDVADELGDLRDSHVKPALSAPPRNCDVGTAEEQSRRY